MLSQLQLRREAVGGEALGAGRESLLFSNGESRAHWLIVSKCVRAMRIDFL